MTIFKMFSELHIKFFHREFKTDSFDLNWFVLSTLRHSFVCYTHFVTAFVRFSDLEHTNTDTNALL